jgi:flagellar biosynthesis/type III secretory pathway M-ring protein FliF/YscJ
MKNQEKRTNYPMPESEMYDIQNIKCAIKQERRKDELDRLIEVQQQKKVWKRVVFTSGSIIIILLFLAYMGWMQNV